MPKSQFLAAWLGLMACILANGPSVSALPVWPVHHAAENGDTRNLANLLKTHPEWLDQEDEEGETALLEAAEEGQLEAVELLLKLGADINHQDQEGETALMEAAEEGKIEVVTLLLRKGASLGCLDRNGLTVAQRNTNQTIKELLQARGAR
jgi:ankyrin repeat protein